MTYYLFSKWILIRVLSGEELDPGGMPDQAPDMSRDGQGSAGRAFFEEERIKPY